MAIEKKQIEAIKHGVDLVALVEAKGIDLKKTAKAGSAFAPSMPTKTHPYPSIQLKTYGNALAAAQPVT